MSDGECVCLHLFVFFCWLAICEFVVLFVFVDLTVRVSLGLFACVFACLWICGFVVL